MARSSTWIVCGACGKEAYADKDYGMCDPCAAKPENQPVWIYNPGAGVSIGQLLTVDELEQAVQQMRGSFPGVYYDPDCGLECTGHQGPNWRSK